MQIAGLITVFNGLELLEPCINNLRGQVDKIIIAWQKTSNLGEYSEQVEEVVNSFDDVELIYFEPNLRIGTKENEINKHNLLINKARELGCSHFVLLATDHFYRDDEFQYAKKIIIENDFDVTFTYMYTYYKHPTWRLEPIENYHMPFICKIYPNTKAKKINNYPVYVDPAVQITPHNKWHLFDGSIMLHHYSKVRNDIENKYRNAAASVNWNKEKVSKFLEEYNNAKLGDSISYYGGRKLIQVGDIFNLCNYINN